MMPVPREGKPTRDEVEDWEICWVFDAGTNAWRQRTGLGAREETAPQIGHWLYKDDIPHPGVPDNSQNG